MKTKEPDNQALTVEQQQQQQQQRISLPVTDKDKTFKPLPCDFESVVEFDPDNWDDGFSDD